MVVIAGKAQHWRTFGAVMCNIFPIAGKTVPPQTGTFLSLFIVLRAAKSARDKKGRSGFPERPRVQ